MTYDIDQLVERFLSWPLPRTVCADTCTVTPDHNNVWHRSGTNLLTQAEAKQMLEYLLEQPESTSWYVLEIWTDKEGWAYLDDYPGTCEGFEQANSLLMKLLAQNDTRYDYRIRAVASQEEAQ
jgi:hypothetical protein